MAKKAEKLTLGPHNLKAPVVDTTVAPLLWTGGFDSTYQLLTLLKESKTVQPIYVRHSRGSNSDWAKGEREDLARKAILKSIAPDQRKLIKPMIVWEHDEFMKDRLYKKLMDAYEMVCSAYNMSTQYAAFRAAKEWTAYDGGLTIQMCVVMYDQLWWNLNSIIRDRPGWTLFNGFEFPLWWVDKSEMWRKSDRTMRSILKMTFSCEREKSMTTCIEDKLKFDWMCTPCRGRLRMLSR